MQTCNKSLTSVDDSQHFLHLSNYSDKKVEVKLNKENTNANEKSLVSIPPSGEVTYCKSCYTDFLSAIGKNFSGFVVSKIHKHEE
jgi:RNase P subunit RPR2